MVEQRYGRESRVAHWVLVSEIVFVMAAAGGMVLLVLLLGVTLLGKLPEKPTLYVVILLSFWAFISVPIPLGIGLGWLIQIGFNATNLNKVRRERMKLNQILRDSLMNPDLPDGVRKQIEAISEPPPEMGRVKRWWLERIGRL